MKKVIYIILLYGFFASCNQKKTSIAATEAKNNITDTSCEFTPTRIVKKEDLSLNIYNFKDLEPLLNSNCEDVHVINFWATWCKPCVAELPYFEQIHNEQNIPVTLISLDIPNLIESKLIPFIQKENLESKVIVLDDPDANSWIPKVAQEWSGAIPATIIIKGEKRKFYEQSFTYESLTEAINTL